MAISVITHHRQGGHAHSRCHMQRARINTQHGSGLLAGSRQFDQASKSAQVLKLGGLQQPVLTIATVVRLLLLTRRSTHQAS